MKKCPFCHEEIQDTAVKCRYCGEWLDKKENSLGSLPQQNTSTADHTEKPIEKAENFYEVILGEKNRGYYLAKFYEFDHQDRKRKASWNWGAFFGGGLWTLYRKMYGWFFGLWGIWTIAGLFEKAGYSILSLFLFLGPWIAFTIYANSLYHVSIKKKIAIAQLSIGDKTKLLEFLRHKGGVHTWVIWVFSLLVVVGIIAAIAIPFFAKQTPTEKVERNKVAMTEAPEPQQVLTAEDWFNKAAILWDEGKYTNPQKAIEYLNNAIKLQPDYAAAYGSRGNAYADLGQHQLAIENYNEVIRLKSNTTTAYLNRGIAYDNLGQQLRAIEDYNEAIRLQSNNATAYLHRGLAYNKLGKKQLSMEDYNEVIRLQPNDAKAYNLRGAGYLMQGNNKRGCSDAQKACALGECTLLELSKRKGNCR